MSHNTPNDLDPGAAKAGSLRESKGPTAISEELSDEREQLDEWLSTHCESGLPHGEATDEASMLHGLAYVLRQIEGTSSYRPHIGQCTSATSALRMALDHFARLALRSGNGGEVATHRHKKRGSEYVLIGIGKMQAGDWQRMVPNTQDGAPGYTMMPADMAEVAIYRSVDDGSLWVRPREEFEDGRFEALDIKP